MGCPCRHPALCLPWRTHGVHTTSCAPALPCAGWAAFPTPAPTAYSRLTGWVDASIDAPHLTIEIVNIADVGLAYFHLLPQVARYCLLAAQRVCGSDEPLASHAPNLRLVAWPPPRLPPLATLPSLLGSVGARLYMTNFFLSAPAPAAAGTT